MDATLYVIKDHIVQVYPGEKIYIEADTLQEHEEKLHKSMRLNIVNPFSHTLTYSARINLMKQKKWIRTSVEPVLPKLQNYEIWSDIITTVILYNFHLKRA